MRRDVPTRRIWLALVLAASGGATLLVAGIALPIVRMGLGGFLVLGLAFAVLDWWRSHRAWRAAPLTMERHIPTALALGVDRVLAFKLGNAGARTWQVQVLDETESRLHVQGMPQTVRVAPGQWVELRYTVQPRQRGEVGLGRTHLRVRSCWGLWDMGYTVGQVQTVYVYPNFAAVARYAWLAGDRRLEQIGIKTFVKRGMGVDFKQLAEYQLGDSVRNIDWKATLRFQRPIVRQYQDERDQRVMFMLDCGRRMRADEGEASADGSHFDQALNALMLLSYVALKEGDEVGVMTFGNADGGTRDFFPRKGAATLNALIASLYDLQPSLTHSDYVAAAQDFMRKHPKRALLILITNFRDEDAPELEPALKLLRSKHLVLVASLRERVVRETIAQPLNKPHAVAEVATAHWFAQSRSDAFRRVMGRDALSVDVEPAKLAVTLVNRYHAVKRSGLL
jgi:uncharacterized protein (DUF58 family)